MNNIQSNPIKFNGSNDPSPLIAREPQPASQQKVDSVRPALTSSPAYPRNYIEQFQKIGASVQRHIEKMIHSQIAQIQEICPDLADIASDYPKTYQVALCLGRILRYLLSLSVKSAKNIAFTIYQMLKAVVYAATHPTKAADEFLLALSQFAKELKKPEVWGRMGASIFGTGAAQFVSGNPLAATMMMVGLSLTGASLFIGALCKLAEDNHLMTKSETLSAYLGNQIKEIPETVMTAFLMTLLMRAFQTTTKTEEIQISFQKEYVNVSLEEATEIAQAYATERGLGNVFYVSIDQSTQSIGFTYWRLDEFGKLVMQGSGVPLPSIEREVMTYAMKVTHPSVAPATLATVGHSLIENHLEKTV